MRMAALIIDFCIIAMVFLLTVYTDEKEILLKCDIPIPTRDLKWNRVNSPMLRNEPGLSVAIEGDSNPDSTSKTKYTSKSSKLVLKMKGDTLNDVYYCDKIFWIENSKGDFEKVPQIDAEAKYGSVLEQENVKLPKDYLQIVQEWVRNMSVGMYILLGSIVVLYLLSLGVIFYTSERLFEVATVYAKIALIMNDGGDTVETLAKLKKKYTKTRST